jgi:hypothetical protein
MAEGFNHSEPIQGTGGSIGLQEKNEYTTGSIVDEFINSESHTRDGAGKKKSCHLRTKNQKFNLKKKSK